jgi:hypothetical protein
MTRPILVLCGTLALLAPSPIDAQSAQEIMREALDRYEARMSDIDDYTVSQTVMGMSTTMHFVRDEVDGRVVYLPDMTQTSMGGQDMGSQQALSTGQYDGNYFMRPDLVERMRVDGTDMVDGHECWIITVDDFEGLDLGDLSGGQQGFEPESMSMCMDRSEYVPRQIDMAGTMDTGGETHAMSTSVLMMDYREVEGMLYPFRMEISTQGLGEAMGAAMGGGMTDEDQAEMTQMMAQMQEELDKLPEEQRAMVEQMMKSQGMQQMMDQALSSVIVETTELLVNAGPPGGA